MCDGLRSSTTEEIAPLFCEHPTIMFYPFQTQFTRLYRVTVVFVAPCVKCEISSLESNFGCISVMALAYM